MPEFLAKMVTDGGFWSVILALIIVGLPFGVLNIVFSHILGKKAVVLQWLFYIPGNLFMYYVWVKRGGAGWLILAIVGTAFVVLSIGIAVLASWARKQLEGPKSDEAVDSFLKSVAEETNKSCPVMIDQETRFDRTVALPNKIFQYYYTFVNASKDAINVEVVKSTLYLSILGGIKSSEELKAFREYGVTMIYIYHDKNGEKVLELVYESKDYA
jgi:hypothetical protein